MLTRFPGQFFLGVQTLGTPSRNSREVAWNVVLPACATPIEPLNTVGPGHGLAKLVPPGMKPWDASSAAMPAPTEASAGVASAATASSANAALSCLVHEDLVI